ncbi:hypothetical protein NM688_g8133 [Phlebia brevispora]|uniref:Uncharacterized protein n=1 Tax=Phlebia brevispora TaxID=194682 RepID=A0ACC1RWV2_9APHY|nr:hypothetical protein NM688_g8133 [Phlebia brevispora]
MRDRTAHESVWDLKQHLLSRGSISLSPSAEADYGFANCGPGSERELLTTVYMAAWKKGEFDEMELHAHYLQGRTLEYLEKFEDLTKERMKLERLMKNSHSA